MRFLPTALEGVLLIEPEPAVDDRGFFLRTWSAAEFEAQGIAGRPAELAFSHSRRRGTVRGLHWQADPHAQAKLVRCSRGAVFDVAVDVRPDSPSFRRWISMELTAENRRALYIPAGFAHGIQTLADDTELTYAFFSPRVPAAERAARWNDPAFGIVWPAADERILSDRDRSPPEFTWRPS